MSNGEIMTVDHRRVQVSARTALLVALAALAAGTSFAGCGGNSKGGEQKQSDQVAVRRVLSDLQAASRAGNGRRICDEIFTSKLAKSVSESAPSGSCATEVRQKLFSPRTRISVNDITVSDSANATATVTEANGNTSTVSLVKQGGRWRIRGVKAA
jgi:hypothetical protein